MDATSQNVTNPAAPDPATAPAGNTAVAPGEAKVVNTGELDSKVHDFIEVSGRRQPENPPKTPESSGKYKTLEEANKGYDELYKLYSQAAGRTANTVEKLEKVIADLPTQLAQVISQAMQTRNPEPAKPVEPERPGAERLFNFTIDDISNPDDLAASLSRQIAPLLSRVAIEPGRLIESIAPKINEIVERQIAAREEQALRTRAENEIKEIVAQGWPQDLVETAVLYGARKNANSVAESWKLFQQNFPQIFADKKAEAIIGEMAGQRQQLPRELGAGANVIDTNALQQAFAKVRDYQFASHALL